MKRTILHSDLNGFYASVECFSNPNIKDMPVAVGGDPELRHGIVLAKNEHAKKFGVTTGEALWQAKQKCPILTVVKPNYDKYLKFSRMAREIYQRYTDQVEAYGIDECWLDVSGSTSLFGTAERIANEIRETIRAELGITASIGVSFNKIFAKLGSDMRKPDATTIISAENYKNTVWKLPVGDLLYVGRATERKLRALRINTIGDLALADEECLYSHLGKWGIVLHHFAGGNDTMEVKRSGEEAFIKSIGNSTTLPRDVSTPEEVGAVMHMLADSVAARLREHRFKATTIQIYVRDNKLFSIDRQAQLTYPSCISSEIAEKAIEIYTNKCKIERPIRTIGVRGTNLVKKDTPYQINLFDNHIRRDRLENLEYAIDDIRRRYGYYAIRKGRLYVDPGLTGINAKDDHVIHPLNYFEGAIM